MIYLKDTKTGEVFAIDDDNVEDFQDYYENPQNLFLSNYKEFENYKLNLNGGI